MRWSTKFWDLFSWHDFTGLNQKKLVSISLQYIQSIKKYTRILYSLHIRIKCAFHGVATLSLFEMRHVPFLRDRRHTLPRGLQTIAVAVADAKVRLHLLTDLPKYHVTSTF